ncbi:plastocyanin/azurin family copper-binding protein [Euzebya sp.]|uniref:cupredoxin domain-containing protein n=1 Tax=Euzebya sp. TaxID=1971409 RepID=UPI003513BC81
MAPTSPAQPTSRVLVPRLALLGLLVIGAAACSSGPDPLEADPVATSSVDVDDNVFEPIAVEVAPGTEVTWTWVGSNDHNVVGDGFESELVTEGTFSHTFEDAGTVEYRCTIHPAMRGVVRVEG